MAGTWIKLQSNLWTNPKVVAISVRILSGFCPEKTGQGCAHVSGVCPDECKISLVVGALARVWAWADEHTTDGIVSDLDAIYVDKLTGIAGFSDAMKAVGWLDFHPGWAGFSFPNFLNHNGVTAKSRATESRRKADRRNVSGFCPENVRKKPDKVARTCPENVRKKPDQRREEKRREEEKEEIHKEESHAAAPPATATEAILTFPVQGTKGLGDDWDLNSDQVDRFGELFPGVDVLAEARKALAWIEADPRRRKTRGGYPRFLTGWLNRTSERLREVVAQGVPSLGPAPNGKQPSELERIMTDCYGGTF